MPIKPPHKTARDNAAAEQALPAIRAALAQADKIYMAFSNSAVTDPANIESHLQPVTEIANTFKKLADMLSTGNRAKDSMLHSSMGDLLHRRRKAYLEELAHIMPQIAPEVPPIARAAHYLNDPQNTLKNVATLPTAEIVIQLNDLKDLANSYHVTVKDGNLAGDLAEIGTAAKAKEMEYKLPKGAVEAFLELDQSRFFAFTAKTAAMPGRDDKLTDLLDKATFNKRLTLRVSEETRHAFPESVFSFLDNPQQASGRMH